MKNLLPLPFSKAGRPTRNGLRRIHLGSETWRFLRLVPVILLLSAASMFAENATLTLEKSTDGLSAWQSVPLTAQMLTVVGSKKEKNA